MKTWLINIKNKIINFLTTSSNNRYEFTIPETPVEASKEGIFPINSFKENTTPENDSSKDIPIYTSLEKNLEFMKVKYNSLINNDIVIRKFTLIAYGKKYDAFLFYIDGMSDTRLINDFVLKPLMLKNTSNTSDAYSKTIIKQNNKTIIKKRRKFDLANHILNSLLPQNAVKKQETFEAIISSINSGNCALFVDTLNIVFDVDVKGFKQRNIDSPNNEVVIKGPQAAFVENIRTNTSLLRQFVNSENLIIENIQVGNISKTYCAICYMQNITNNDLVAEVKYRINNLKIDSLLSSGELEQLIVEDSNTTVPLIMSTERPDKASKNLYEGKVIVLVNGNPYALIMPTTYIDFIASPEDSNLKPPFANFLKAIRGLSILITLLLPAVWIAIINFHQELIPTELLFSIIASRENVPFPIIFELLLMEFSFELIREAGLRVPSPIGPTIRNCWCSCFRASRCKCKHCKSYFDNYYCINRYCIFCSSRLCIWFSY